MRGLDTNVLVRYLVQDDARQAAIATAFIERYCTDDAPCFIGQITLCELAWVLESNYNLGREAIANVIEQLLQVGQLDIMQPAVVWRALNDYRSSNADFPDHLSARANEHKGCETTVTFDKRAAKHAAFELLK